MLLSYQINLRIQSHPHTNPIIISSLPLDVASKSKRKAEEDLALVNERLAVIEGKLAKLQAEFMAATQEKGRVESEVSQCEIEDQVN